LRTLATHCHDDFCTIIWEESMSRLLVLSLVVLVLAGDPLLSQTAAPVPPDKAQIQVRLPAANARLTIAGDPTNQTGEVRLFESPVLQPDGCYSYELVASWEKDGKPVTVRRVVPILRGRSVLVDFTRESPSREKELSGPGRQNEQPLEDLKDFEKLRVPPTDKSQE
jgi:uncharacterized protein (TIGR03000 family)